MGSSSTRTVGVNRSADLGGMYIAFDDLENPTLATPAPSRAAQPFSGWLPEYHTSTDYQSKVLADNPSVYWRLGENSGLVANDSSGHSRSGLYVGSRADVGNPQHPDGLNVHGAVTEADAANGNQVDGGAVDLDGATQWIASGVRSRRNLVTNPSLENDTSGWGPWFSSASSITRFTGQHQTGVASLRAVAQPSGQGAGSAGIPATAGKYYSAAAQVLGGSGGQIGFHLCFQNSAGAALRCDAVSVNNGFNWGRAVINGSSFGAAPAGTTQAFVFANNERSSAQDVYIDAVQVEGESSIASYFDGSSPNAHWDGVANNSTSSIDGAFNNGGAHTYEGWAYRDTSSTVDTLIGGDSTTSPPRLRLEAGSNEVTWRADSGAGSVKTWSGAWPGNSQWVHWALVFDEPANTASLFINGELVSAQTDTDQFNSLPGNLLAGARYQGADLFDGKLDEVAVYNQALSADRIQTHYLAGPSGIGWASLTASDNGVGVQSIKLGYTNASGQQVTQSADPDPVCVGSRQSNALCKVSRTDDVPFNTNGKPLPEGISTLTVNSNDALGKAATPRTFEVKVDRSSPAMAVTGGLRSQSTPGYDLHVATTDGNAGTHSNADRPNARSGMKRIDLYMDGSATPLVATANQACTDSWGSCPLSLDYTLNPANYSEGDHSFKVVATDQLGHQGSDQWSQFVENVPPTVSSISGPLTQGWLTGNTQRVDVAASDLGAGVQKITLDVPQAAGPVSTVSHTFSCSPRCPTSPTASWDINTSTLPEGLNTLTAKAFGINGDASAPKTIQVKVDKSPAVITAVTGPPNWLKTGNGSVTVSAENPVAGVDHIALDLPGGQSMTHAFDCTTACPASVNYSFSFDSTALPNGAGDGVVHAYGPGGVASQAGHGPIEIDHSAPDLSADGPLFNSSAALIGATAGTAVQVTDSGSGLQSLALLVDGTLVDSKQPDDFADDAQTCTGATCSFSGDDWFDLSGLAAGTHTVRLTASDLAGNTDFVENTIRLDPTSPVINVSGLLADLDGQPLTQNDAGATVSATDSAGGDSGLSGVVFTLDGQQVGQYPSTCAPTCPATVQQSYTYHRADWEPGPHDLTITATDAAGNESERVIVVDRPPEPPSNTCAVNTPTTTAASDPLSASQVAANLGQGPGSPIAPTIPYGEDGSTDGINDQVDPTLVPPASGSNEADPNIDSADTPVESSTSSAPAGGVLIGDVCLQPQSTTNAETSAYVTPDDSGSGDAAIYANSGPDMDTIYRPTPTGGALVINDRGPDAPDTVSWTIDLDPGEQLEHLSSGGIAIVDTTTEDPDPCAVPPAPPEGGTIAAIADADTQRAQTEHDICSANNEIDDGLVTAVIAPPIAEDQAHDPLPVTIDFVDIPDLPPAIVMDAPPELPSKREILLNAELGYDAKDCNGIPSPCGAYDDVGAVRYATRYGATPNGRFTDYLANDCTNFMSQALNAGDLEEMREGDTGKGSWWVIPPKLVPPITTPQRDTHSWTVADDLARHLWYYGLVKKVAHKPSEFRGGDLIVLDWDWGNEPGHGTFDHFQLVTRGGQDGDDPQMAQHSDLDYSGFHWTTVVNRISKLQGEGDLWKGWGYIVLRPIHSRANIGAKVHDWGSL